MKKLLKDSAKSVLRLAYRAGLQLGLFILPVHYYVPIADPRQLKAGRKHWAVRSAMHGVVMDTDAQIAFLIKSVAPFEPEYRGNPYYKTATIGTFGPGYGVIEAQALHGMVRSLKPKKIIEVGSGASTYCMLQALTLNAAEGSPAAIICVEPYPSEFLRGSDEITLMSTPVQELSPEFFDQLDSGDLLFIDSTHAIKPGGDVLYLYLSVIPRLKPGVVVHIHDIFLPYIHQRDVIDSLFQWNETSILLALLTNNSQLSVLACLSLLHYDCPRALKAIFPEYIPQEATDGLVSGSLEGHFPSSIYLQIAAPHQAH
jgi:hypothetical protein